jgi:hypothetical protein
LGVVLAIACAAKIHEAIIDPAGAIEQSYGSRWIGVGLVACEAAFSVWLVSGVRARQAWFVAILCFVGFAGISLIKALAHQTSCGCFGKVRISPWYTFCFDAAVVAVLVCWHREAELLRHRTASHVRAVAMTILAAAIGTASGLAVAVGTASRDVGDAQAGRASLLTIEPVRWIGRPFPLAEHVKIDADLMVGDWTVLLYRHDCRTCRDVIPRYQQLAGDLFGQSPLRRVAFIQLPPHGNPPAELDAPQAPWVHATLSDAHQWLATVPIEVRLCNGRVIDGEVIKK